MAERGSRMGTGPSKTKPIRSYTFQYVYDFIPSVPGNILYG